MRIMPRVRMVGVVVLLLAGLGLAACGGSADDKPATGTNGEQGSGGAAAATGTAPAAPFAPVVAVTELAPGANRFAMGLIDNANNQPVADATMHFRFFTVQGNQGTVKGEADAQFIAPARDAGISGIINHVHIDGTAHPHDNGLSDLGVYIAQVQFDQPGSWGVEATFQTKDGRTGKVAVPFQVLEKPITPAVGEPAPRTRNLTAKDVKDLREIDTSAEPSPLFHQDTVADAIAAGRPALVAFLTPGYCSSRFCGPEMEIMKKLEPAYGSRVAMIHIEVWKDPLKRIPFEAVTEWRLQTEPYFFVVDRNGVIAAKFEGPTSMAELDAALAKVVGGS